MRQGLEIKNKKTKCKIFSKATCHEGSEPAGSNNFRQTDMAKTNQERDVGMPCQLIKE